MKKLLFVLMSLISLTAHAYDFEVDGISYNVLSPGDLTCEVAKVDEDWVERPEYTGEIVIPETVFFIKKIKVVGIGERAFENQKMELVVLPSSVTSIGKGAFQNCNNLKSVVIPSSVTRINASVFSGCKSLLSVVIPPSVTIIDNDAFY